jgi:hypothetical protein
MTDAVVPRIVAVEVAPTEVLEIEDPRGPAGFAGYGYLSGSSIASCLPFYMEGRYVGEERIAAFIASGPRPTSILPSSLSAAESGIEVARQLLRTLSPECRKSIGGVIYCHESLEESIDSVAVTRLCVDLELDGALAFSLSQYHNCSVFAALRFANALLRSHTLAGVLIVAVDKWRYPFFRSFGDSGTFGDGAAAMAVVASDSLQGFAVRRVAMKPGDSRIDIYSGAAAFDPQRLVQRIVASMREILADRAMDIADIGSLINPGGCESVVRQVNKALALPAAVVQYPARGTPHQSSADPISALATLWQDRSVRVGAKTLWWNYGVRGEVACAVLERCALESGGDA